MGATWWRTTAQQVFSVVLPAWRESACPSACQVQTTPRVFAATKRAGKCSVYVCHTCLLYMQRLALSTSSRSNVKIHTFTMCLQDMQLQPPQLQAQRRSLWLGLRHWTRACWIWERPTNLLTKRVQNLFLAALQVCALARQVMFPSGPLQTHLPAKLLQMRTD